MLASSPSLTFYIRQSAEKPIILAAVIQSTPQPHKCQASGFPLLDAFILSSQCCPSLFVTVTALTLSLSKHWKLILYPSGKLLGTVNGEIPHVLQNQCFAVPVLNLYSERFSAPEREVRAGAGIVKPRKPFMEQMLQLHSSMFRVGEWRMVNFMAAQWQEPLWRTFSAIWGGWWGGGVRGGWGSGCRG